PHPETFDLAADPLERHAVHFDAPEDARLTRALDAATQQASRNASPGETREPKSGCGRWDTAADVTRVARPPRHAALSNSSLMDFPLRSPSNVTAMAS